MAGRAPGRLLRIACSVLLLGLVWPPPAQAAGGVGEVVDLTSHHDEWSAYTCHANAWLDFKVTIDTDTALDNNMIVEVVDKATDTRTNALTLYLFGDHIPVTRTSAVYDDLAVDNVYTVAINEMDMHAQDYYFSVKCGPQDVDFEINPFFVHVHLTAGHATHGEVCLNQWMYHKITVDQDMLDAAGTGGSAWNIDIDFAVHHYDAVIITGEDHHPLMLVPPWLHVQDTDGHVTIQLCDVHAGHVYYIGVVGQEHCTDYDVTFTVHMDPDEACHEMVSSEEDLTDTTTELDIGYFQYAESTPMAYQDYHFYYDADAEEGNVMVEIVDLESDFSPDALCLKVWYDSVPTNRESEVRADFATSEGVYSVAINWYDVKTGHYYVSVLGGSMPRKYKIIVMVIQAPVHDGETIIGNVCPGEFIYHYYNYDSTVHPGDGAHNIQFEMIIHNGNFMYMTAHDHAPLKIIAPYEHIDYETAIEDGHAHVTKHIDLCDVHDGKQFLALSGGDACAEYELSVRVMDEAEECHELEATCVEACIFMCEVIEENHFINESCEEGEIKDFMLDVGDTHAHDNLVFEIEDVTGHRNPSALLVRHYYEDLPNDRKDTTLYTDYADGFIYSIAISSHDLHMGLHFISVKCTSVGVRFRLLARFVPAELVEASWTEGEVCTQQWIYHTITVDSHGVVEGSLANQSGSTDHRRALLSGLEQDAHTIMDNGGNPVTIVDDRTGAKNSRALQSEHEDLTNTVGHARVEIKLHTGYVYYMSRHNHPPVRLSPPYAHGSSIKQLANHNAVDSFYLCDLTEGTHYIGLYGERDCTAYEITMHLIDHAEECHEMEFDSADIADVATSNMEQIEFGHFMTGECTPEAYQDYRMEVTADHAGENLVVEVQDISGDIDPHGLTVMLFEEDGMDLTRLSEMQTNQATLSGKYSLAINAVALTEGVLTVSVKCHSKARRFRIIAELIPEQMYDDHTTTSGVVCPGDLIYHSFDTQNPNGSGDDSGHRRALRSTTSTNPNIKWVLELHEGDVYVMVAQHDHPMRVVPPYQHMTAAEHIAAGHGKEVYLCNPETGTHYIALAGGSECSTYDIYVVEDDSNVCTEFEHCPEGGCGNSTPTLTAGVYHLESCAPNQYRDFLIHVDEDHSDDNIVVEVEDLEETVDASSLEVSLFQGSIPSDRVTEFYDSFSNTGVWSVAVSSHDLVAGDYYFSVRCAPHVSVNFRILLVEFPSELAEGHHQHGEVCPGTWVYHHYEVPHTIVPASTDHRRARRSKRRLQATEETTAVATQHHLKMEIEMHDGDLYYMMRPNTPPIEFAPPYQYAKSDPNSATGSVMYEAHWCNLESSGAHSYYVGLLGSDECASYIMGVEMYTGECQGQFEHSANATAVLNDLSVKTLTDGHYVYATCSPNSWVDFKFTLTDEDAENNMAIKVEDLSENVNPNSLLVHLYEFVTEIPTPREKYAKMDTDTARGQVYFIGKDAIEVLPGDYMVGVQCQAAQVRFRIALNSIPVKLEANLVQLGQVSPDAWVYHQFSLYEELTADELAAANAPRHITYTVEVFSGHIYVAAARFKKPPGFAAGLDNVYLQQLGDDTTFEVTLCNAGIGIADIAYLGLYGGSEFASYQVTVTISDGFCDTSSLPGYNTAAASSRRRR